MWNRASFRTQLSLLVFIGLFVVVLIASISASWIASRVVTRDYLQHGETLVRAFAKQSVLALLYESETSAKEAASMILAFHPVKQAAIFNEKGTLLYQNTKIQNWTKPTTHVSSLLLEHEDNRYWQFAAPAEVSPQKNMLEEGTISSNQPNDVGFVRILLSKDELLSIRKQITWVITLMAIVAGAILWIALQWLLRRMTFPLQSFAKTMHRAEAQETGLRVELSGSKELLQMGRAFNTMMQILEEREAKLNSSEARYRTLTTVSPVGIFYTDLKGQYLYANEVWHILTGLNADRAKSVGWFNVLHDEDRNRVIELWQTATRHKQPFKAEFRLCLNDGITHWVFGQAIPENDAVQNYVGTLTDITKLREAEERIKQHQLELAHFSRLKAVGEMASGMAHELNQPLTAIVHYIGGCVERLKREHVSPQIIEVMHRVNTLAEHAGAIIHRLKDFLRKGDLQKECIDVNALIQEVLKLIELELTEAKIQVTLHLFDKLPNIQADKIHIEQILLNLVQNAIDAMRSVDIKTRKLTFETLLSDKDAIKVLVSDTGPGIPNEWVEKIFDPFFTTKESGMGIGLSISSSIVENHGGKLSVESNFGFGTQFSLVLPIGEDENGTAQ